MFVHLSVHFHPCSLIFHFISSYYFCMFHSTEPVGYGDALIAILPSFPGIKKLQ